jgi:hypothetical protein
LEFLRPVLISASTGMFESAHASDGELGQVAVDGRRPPEHVVGQDRKVAAVNRDSFGE